jgi:hypothetical protein
VGVSFILLESVLFIAVTSLFVALGLYPFRRKHKTKNKQKAPITLVNSYFTIFNSELTLIHDLSDKSQENKN